MKTYGPISVDLREKQKNNIFSFISLSLFSRSHSHSLPVPPPFLFFLILFDFFSYSFFLFILFYFYFPYFFFVLSFPLFPLLDTWLNVIHSHKCPTCHAMCHSTPDASKNMKFLLSQNLTKFDELTRFRETNSMVKSVL